MQTTAIRTVANSLPENEVILLTLLISKRYIPYTDLHKKDEYPRSDKLCIIADGAGCTADDVEHKNGVANYKADNAD